jgi:hypothetical protein
VRRHKSHHSRCITLSVAAATTAPSTPRRFSIRIIITVRCCCVRKRERVGFGATSQYGERGDREGARCVLGVGRAPSGSNLRCRRGDTLPAAPQRAAPSMCNAACERGRGAVLGSILKEGRKQKEECE